MKKTNITKEKKFRKISKVQSTKKTESPSDFLHDKSSNKKQIFTWLGILIFLAIGTTLAVFYARGYRFSIGDGEPKLSKTGILNISSTPQGSQVFINDHLTTATNDSINLTPGKYSIKIAKDGYNDWLKDVEIKQEEVTTTQALLFPRSPSLKSISTLGVNEAVMDPTGTKLAFKIASASARQNGIYIFDMTQRSLPILQGQGSSQLADDTINSFSSSNISFSPDGKQLLASISATQAIDDLGPTQENPDTATYYLLEIDSFNDNPRDITPTIFSTLDLWTNQTTDKENSRIKSLKPDLANFYQENFNVLSWSPDEKKILYQASKSAEMPIFIKKRRIGNNLLYERRDLEKNAIYVYDTTEDINTRVVGPTEKICHDFDRNCTVTFNWFPDSEHIVYVIDGKINIVENDGANLTTIYAGPFLGRYVFPWPDGSKLVILTDLGNTNVPPTLYTIGLK